MPKFSTGLRAAMLATFKDQMDGSELRIFSVANLVDIPATSDAAEAGTLLMTLTASGNGSTGLTFALPADGAISKSEAEVWMTSAIAEDGKCAYFRVVPMGDDGLESVDSPRIQGTCGLVAADMVLTNVNVTAGLPWTLNFFTVGLPTQ